MKDRSQDNSNSKVVPLDFIQGKSEKLTRDSILHDIEVALQVLVGHGTETVIELNSENIDSQTEKQIRDFLGSGEVKATLEIFGKDIIQETTIHGVWWVYHADDSGAILTKSIYISYVPSILPAQQEDVEYSLSVLRKKMSRLY